jgi:hypothetical protein
VAEIAMSVEGHSASHNFSCKLISASPSWRAFKPLGVQRNGARKPYREEYMKVILPIVIYFAIWAAVIYGSIYFNKNVR